MGCIVPRTIHYWRGIRAEPPPAPRHLTRLPDHTTYETDDRGAGRARPRTDGAAQARLPAAHRRRRRRRRRDAVSAERGYLREVGNLLFHLSVLVVLVGFATGGLLGYKGSVIVVEGGGFSNNPNQYDDFVPGKLFTLDDLDDFSFDVDGFDVEWLTEGPQAGTARGFRAGLSYRGSDAEEKTYDLRVNHPLKIESTELFLVGHGYAPVVTVRDGNGEVAYSGPTIFLPESANFLSFGVVKAPDAQPAGLGLEGLFYPTFIKNTEGDPVNLMGDDNNPLLSLLVYAGDLNMDGGPSQSIYVLDKSKAEQVLKPDGAPLRLDLSQGESVRLPDGLGTVTFEGLEPWVRVQVSKTPGQWVALSGVVLALLGLLGSLFIRPRRVWVRARRRRDEGEPGTMEEITVVEVAALDRSGGGDVTAVLAALVADLRAAPGGPTMEEQT